MFQKSHKEKTYVTYKSIYIYIKYILDIYSKYMFDTIFKLALLEHRTNLNYNLYPNPNIKFDLFPYRLCHMMHVTKLVFADNLPEKYYRVNDLLIA